MINVGHDYKLLSILMPVYNESRTLRTILARVLASRVPLPVEVICVDDCSRDNSWQILQQLAAADSRIRIVQHQSNSGKAAAIRTAIAAMRGDIGLIQDADLEYDPADYSKLLAPLLDGRADVVFGSRFAFNPQRKVLHYWHQQANKFLTWVTNILLDINLTDMETCYKAVRADILRQIPLKAQRFGLEPELSARLAQWQIRIYEVPISYHGRSVAEGKNIGLKDAIEALWVLFRCRYIDQRFTTHSDYYILQSIRKARRLKRWTKSRFQQAIGRRVLEVGCGIGNFTELLLSCPEIVAVDNDPFYVERLNLRFGHLENLRVLRGDLALAAPAAAGVTGGFDTVIALNVIQRLADDTAALKNYFSLLTPGGTLILMVPAQPRLKNHIDESLGHFRRYDAGDLRQKLLAAGFTIRNMQNFNRMGAWGWRLSGACGMRHLSQRQMRLFDALLPLAKLRECVPLGSGLNLIAIADKPK